MSETDLASFDADPGSRGRHLSVAAKNPRRLTAPMRRQRMPFTGANQYRARFWLSQTTSAANTSGSPSFRRA